MLSEAMMQQIEIEAKTAAMNLNDEQLRKEATRAETEWRNAPPGDSCDRWAVIARVWRLELGRRKLLTN